MNAHLKTVVKNEETYMEIQDISLKFTTTRMHIKLENLFNGDKVLGKPLVTKNYMLAGFSWKSFFFFF